MSNIINEKNNNININNIKILSVKDFSYKPEYPNLSYKIPQDILYSNYDENEEKNKNKKINNTNLSLVHNIENSLINKDYDTFLWCLQQENKEIIIESVKKMNRDTIEMFFEKVIDLFQSNNFYKKNVVIWIIEIFKYHKFEILSMENKIIKNLNIIKNYIANYTKNYNNLIRLQEKLNVINKYKNNNNNNQKNININDGSNINKNNNNPLLTYMESDDEEEIEENKNKIKKLKEKGFEEVDSDNKSNNNENEMDIDDENNLDNEDQNDFDIDENEESIEESIQSEEENIFNNKKKKNITNEEDEEEEEEDEK